MSYPSSELVIDPLLMGKYDVGGPRYTSYPTADRFVEAFSEETYRYWLSSRTIGGINRPLALQIRSLFFTEMRCRTGKTRRRHNRSDSERYIGYLAREIGLTAGLLGAERAVSQIHFGARTLSVSGHEALRSLFRVMETDFAITSDCEVSIEIDVREVESGMVTALSELGFNRISLNIPQQRPLQKAQQGVRVGSIVRHVVDEARASGFRSIDVELSYGLAGQTLETFHHTLDTVLSLEPDRVTLRNSRHRSLPVRSRPGISAAEPPAVETNLQILTLAIGRLLRAGYLYIGMDLFAKHDDALALAQRQGRLQHNCQGYSPYPECDSVGFGTSAISRVGPSYSHNARDIKEYYAALDLGRLPVRTGLVLSKDDLVRRAVIQSLLCQSRLSIDAIQASYLLDFRRYFAIELEELAALEADGLVEIESDWINVTARGRLLAHAVCAVFDRYEREGRRWSGCPEEA